MKGSKFPRTPRTTKPQRKLHYLANSVGDAIERMSGLYRPEDQQSEDFDRNQSVISRFRAADLPEAYGTFSIPDTPDQIGMVGKIWAMLCLLPLSEKLQLVVRRRANTCAHEILKAESYDLKQVRRLAACIKTTTTDFTTGPYDGLDISLAQLKSFYESVLQYAVRIVSEETPSKSKENNEGKLRSVLANAHPSPEVCAKYIYEAFNLGKLERGPRTKAPPAPLPHYFEPLMDEFMRLSVFTPSRDEDTEIKDCIQQIYVKFQYQKEPQKPIIALLQGNEQSGKKSIVGDFLRGLRSEKTAEEGYSFPIRFHNKTEKELPILVISLRDHDYLSLCALVLAFLRWQKGVGVDYKTIDKYAQHLRKEFGYGGSIDELIQQIETEHEGNPALFIFLDAHGLDRDSLQRVLRHSGLYRLLVRLWRTEDQSRYLITTARMDRTNVPKELELNEPTIVVPMPGFDRFAWCLPDTDRDRYRLVTDRGSHEDRLRSYWEKNGKRIEVTGDALLILSVLYTLQYDELKFDGLVKTYLAQRSKGGETAENADSEIYRVLIETLENAGVLLPVALIAAAGVTEDVLNDGTLEVLVSKFHKERGIEEAPDQRVSMRQTLETLRTAARKLFIPQIRQISPDEEEFSFFEGATPEMTTWHMGASIANNLLKEMMSTKARGEHASIARDALRLIATAARRRAQWKRMRRAEDASIEDRQDTARDIQSYVALLTSLPPRDSAEWKRDVSEDTKSPRVRSLHRSVNSVFTIGDRFSPQTAFRFAVICLLRQQIDHNHRLSMVTDQDELRLKLYLLIFLDVGQLRRFTIADLRDNPKPETLLKGPGINPDVVEALGAELCVDLLLSVALAAFHSQLPKVVAWAWKASEELARERGEDWEIATRSRLACTVADAGILAGQHIIEKGGNLNEILAFANRQSALIVKELKYDPIEEKLEVKGSFALLKARMRLAAREAELTWIALDDGKNADVTYSRLEDLEDALADIGEQGPPIVLSGRTARRYARFQGDDFPLLAKPWFAQGIGSRAEEDVRRNVLFVIQTNINRLNEYGGADRIGVLLDQARRYCVRQKFEEAKKFVCDAEARLDFSRISHGGKLEVFQVKAALAIISAEAAVAQNLAADIDLESSQESTDELLAIAEDLNLLPAIASGYFLQARINILRRFLDGQPILENDEENPMKKAIKYADRAGYALLSSCAADWVKAARTFVKPSEAVRTEFE